MEQEDLSSLLEKKFQPVSKFPSVERDLTFVIDETVSALDIQKEIKKQAGSFLKSIEVLTPIPLKISVFLCPFV